MFELPGSREGVVWDVPLACTLQGPAASVSCSLKIQFLCYGEVVSEKKKTFLFDSATICCNEKCLHGKSPPNALIGMVP